MMEVNMDFNQIKNIIKDFENSNITSLELEMENLKLKLHKNLDKVKVISEAEVKDETTIKVNEDNSFLVKSPLVGIFYEASSPKDDPYVVEGQKVSKGDTLCIVEAMKIMNEITAPVSGVIESINVKNGEAVGFDQVIMTII